MIRRPKLASRPPRSSMQEAEVKAEELKTEKQQVGHRAEAEVASPSSSGGSSSTSACSSVVLATSSSSTCFAAEEAPAEHQEAEEARPCDRQAKQARQQQDGPAESGKAPLGLEGPEVGGDAEETSGGELDTCQEADLDRRSSPVGRVGSSPVSLVTLQLEAAQQHSSEPTSAHLQGRLSHNRMSRESAYSFHLGNRNTASNNLYSQLYSSHRTRSPPIQIKPLQVGQSHRKRSLKMAPEHGHDNEHSSTEVPTCALLVEPSSNGAPTNLFRQAPPFHWLVGGRNSSSSSARQTPLVRRTSAILASQTGGNSSGPNSASSLAVVVPPRERSSLSDAAGGRCWGDTELTAGHQEPETVCGVAGQEEIRTVKEGDPRRVGRSARRTASAATGQPSNVPCGQMQEAAQSSKQSFSARRLAQPLRLQLVATSWYSSFHPLRPQSAHCFPCVNVCEFVCAHLAEIVFPQSFRRLSKSTGRTSAG